MTMFSKLIGVVHGNLIPAEISKKILTGIQNNEIDLELLAEYNISINEIERLNILYQAKLREIPPEKDQPRYLHFYYLLQDKFPLISWEIKNRKDGKVLVNFTLPLVNFLQPSMLSFLLERVSVVNKWALLNYYSCAKEVSSNIILPLEKFMIDTQVIYPEEFAMKKILEWIRLAKRDNRSTLFIHTCPDFSAAPTNDAARPYKHTLESVGDGIGQIAKRIVNILPNLKELLNALNIHPTIVVTIADYEAFSSETLQKVKVSKEEFLRRVEQSRVAFEKIGESFLPMTVKMFTDLCGGEASWLKKVEELKTSFKNGDFGCSGLTDEIFLKIAYGRKSLYGRWLGNKDTPDAYIPFAKNQAAEYAAISYYITHQFENCLVLGADSCIFAPFYSFYRITPTLYFKRFYY